MCPTCIVDRSPTTFDPPLTAGGYLRLRRTAAGLAMTDVRQHCRADADANFVAVLASIENDRTSATPRELAMLATAFPFDQSVYANLRDDLPAGRICHTCGCSWSDPCHHDGTACAWVSTVHDLCTACAAPRPVPPVHLLDHSDVPSMMVELANLDDGTHPILLDDGREIAGFVIETRLFAGRRQPVVVLIGKTASVRA